MFDSRRRGVESGRVAHESTENELTGVKSGVHAFQSNHPNHVYVVIHTYVNHNMPCWLCTQRTKLFSTVIIKNKAALAGNSEPLFKESIFIMMQTFRQ